MKLDKEQDIDMMTYADKEYIMKNCITDERTNISYTLVGDVYLPNLVVPKAKTFQLGRFGKMHKQWLKENHKSIYTAKLMSGELDSYLKDIDNQAQNMYDSLVKKLVEQEGITEQLKADDMMAWVRAMNNISNRAKEITISTIINN